MIPAALDECDHIVSRKEVALAHQFERAETPVYAVHAQMRRHVVLQAIFLLSQTTSVSRRQGGQETVQRLV